MKDSVSIIFNPGQGDVGTKSLVLKVGDPYGTLPRPYLTGYIFDGWYTSPEGGEKIVSSDYVSFTEETVLYAHWVKAVKTRKKSLYRTQRRAVILLVALVVLLGAAVPVVNYFVNRETFVDSTGVKYYAKKAAPADDEEGDPIYQLFDKDGNRVAKTPDDDYYAVASGELVEVDEETGECTVVAAVDINGTEEIGANRRVLIFPYVTQENVASISIKNSHGSFSFTNDDNLVLQPVGYENRVYVDDSYYIMCASLCSACGYTLTKERLENPLKDENGQFSEYGLVAETRTDDDGLDYEYQPAEYTITDRSGNAYTLIVGDLLVSGGGYYVQYKGRDAVYILDTTLEIVFRELKDFLSPAIVLPTSSSNYYDVYDFLILKLDYSKVKETGNNADLISEPVICFGFLPLADREGSIDSTDAYKIYSTNLNNFAADSDNILNYVLLKFCLMEFKGIAYYDLSKITEEELDSFGLLYPAYSISFKQGSLSDGNGGTYTGRNSITVSKKTPQGSYYVSSDVWNMIVEVDSDYLSFLEWTPMKWINSPFFSVDITYMEKLEVIAPDFSRIFYFDNYASEKDENGNATTSSLQIRTDKGETIGDIDNFKHFYEVLLFSDIVGDADLTEEQMANFRAMDDSACQLILKYRATDAKGKTVEHTIRFYQYSERQSYITIDNQGSFYVLSSRPAKIISDAMKVVAGETVDYEAKT